MAFVCIPYLNISTQKLEVDVPPDFQFAFFVIMDSQDQNRVAQLFSLVFKFTMFYTRKDTGNTPLSSFARSN